MHPSSGWSCELPLQLASNPPGFPRTLSPTSREEPGAPGGEARPWASTWFLRAGPRDLLAPTLHLSFGVSKGTPARGSPGVADIRPGHLATVQQLPTQASGGPPCWQGDARLGCPCRGNIWVGDRAPVQSCPFLLLRCRFAESK